MPVLEYSPLSWMGTDDVEGAHIKSGGFEPPVSTPASFFGFIFMLPQEVK
jgi:hypothetical protein